MFLELELLNREPKNGIVGIDLRIVALVKGCSALCEAGRTLVVAFVSV